MKPKQTPKKAASAAPAAAPAAVSASDPSVAQIIDEPALEHEEILDQQDLSLDIIDDVLIEQASEKPALPPAEKSAPAKGK